MDFGLLPKTLQFIASLSLAMNVSATPAPEVNLTSPDFISSQNIQADQIQSLDVVKPNTNIELVMKEPEPLALITVEQPVTVTLPSPKPTPEPEEEKLEEGFQLIKEAKAEEPSTSPSSSPSTSPSSTPAPSPSTVASGSISTDSNGERMFQMVNEYRAGKGLASFEKDGRLCEIAVKRAPQVNGELANGTLHKGFKDLNLPYWATENIVAYSTLEQNLQFWLSDYIHKKAIESDNKYSCTACSGTSCSQIFTSFVSK